MEDGPLLTVTSTVAPLLNGVPGLRSWSMMRAKQKMADLNAHDIDAASQMVIGSARSMGVEVIGE